MCLPNSRVVLETFPMLSGCVIGGRQRVVLHRNRRFLAIASPLIPRMARAADIRRLTVRVLGNWRGQVTLIAMAI